uniref:Uncharacterized protein n=1 Tax=Picea sitchensis TaxID=3332 RepID=D5AAX8_PICSI|nr:unknown [Picea sitchensis]
MFSHKYNSLRLGVFQVSKYLWFALECFSIVVLCGCFVCFWVQVFVFLSDFCKSVSTGFFIV